MSKKRLVFDSLFIILCISIFASIRVVFELYLPKNDVDAGLIISGFSTSYTIFLYFSLIIIFFIYGWTLRRWFIKRDLEENDTSLKHIYLIFLPIIILITINYALVSIFSFSLPSFYVQISSAFFEVLQLIAISTTIGILLYPQIEERLGLLFFKEILHDDENKLGLGSFQKQVRIHVKKYWKILMLILGVVIILSNFLVFIIYPSIPVTSSETLTIFYPNLKYIYDPSTGFRQKFFDYTNIPPSVLVDWKLVQSIMCLLIFGFIALMIYLPSKIDKPNNLRMKEVKEKPKEEISQENIAYNILTQSVELEEYDPPHIVRSTSKRGIKKIISRTKKSDFISIMGLLCFNTALSVVIIFIFQNMGLISVASLQIDDLYDGLFIDFSQLYWAGFNEEITFRFLILGVPLFIIYVIIFLILRLIKYKNQKSEAEEKLNNSHNFLDKINNTNPLLYLIGGWKRIDFIGLILLVFSSFCFGYVHYANGWGAWKIIQAGVAGVVFGYAYIMYGFHVSIFLHAANNFIIGYLITPNYGLIINGEFLFIVTTFLGALMLFYAFMIVLSKFFKGVNHMFRRYNQELS